MDNAQILEKLGVLKALISEIENDLGYTPDALSFNDDFQILKELLNSPEWPTAVDPILICDEKSGDDKMNRAQGILENIVTEPIAGKKVLDFGTGEGHVIKAAVEKHAAFAVGFDIKNNFIDKKRNMEFSTDWKIVQQNAPYDIIIICDTLDHLENLTPYDVLAKAKSVLTPEGSVFVRYHNYMSRHATHLYKKLNKAFVHLVFTENEIATLIPNLEKVPTNKVYFPIKTYFDTINQAKLKITNEYKVTTPVEPFFEKAEIVTRISQNTPFKTLPRMQMEIDFVDYILKHQ